MRNRSILTALFLVVYCMLTGQERRPILSTYALEAGAGNVTDTYLSPLRYSGFNMALSGRWGKDLPFGQKLDMVFFGRMEGMHLNNLAGNAVEWQGGIGFDWVMRRTWELYPHLTMSAGGGAGLYVGAVYLPRNSNNPAAAKGQIALKTTAALTYHARIGNFPVTISDEVLSPFVGALFSQNYGQPYYIIYLGDRKGLVKAGWWGNNFCIDNLAGCKLHFKRGAIGIGYRFRMYSSYIHHLDTRITSHSIVISWSPQH